MIKNGSQRSFNGEGIGDKASMVINAPQPRPCRQARRMRGVDNPSGPEEKTGVVKNFTGVPNGLARIVNNWLLGNSSLEAFKNGFVQEADVVFKFEKMFKKLQGAMSPLMVNDEGKLKTFKVRSRWNMDYDYGSHVAAQILDDVKGLKNAVHLVLTLEHGKVRELMPDWWCYGEREYITIVIGKLMSEFLRKYRAWRKRQKLANNFVTWVLEFHEKSGYPHIHCMFYGKYIAPLEVLHEMWGLCDFNGVRLGGTKGGKRFVTGYTIVGYLTRYVTKEIDKMLDNKDRRKIAAMMWFFKRRLYNVRHYKKGNLIPGDVKMSKWSLYVSEGKRAIGRRIDEFIEKLERENRGEIRLLSG